MIPHEKEKLIPELQHEIDDGTHVPHLLENTHPAPHRLSGRWYGRAFGLIVALGAIILFVPFRESVTGDARVVPLEARVLNAVEDGILKDIQCEEGAFVEAGQVIGHLYNDDLEVALKQEEESLDITQKNIEQLTSKVAWLEKMHERKKALYDEGVIPLIDFEEVDLELEYTKKECDIAHDRVGYLGKKIELLKKRKENTTLIAPIAGVVSFKRQEKVGAFFNRGDEICEVADMSGILLEVQVDERSVKRIEEGMPVAVRFHAITAGKTKGSVYKIHHVAWERVRKVWVKENVVNVLIKPDHIPAGVKRGMTAAIKIHGRKKVLALLLLNGIG